MADERDNTMNLDLNLGPISPVSLGLAAGAGSGSSLGAAELDEFLEERLREFRQRIRQRWRWRDWRQLQMNPSLTSDISMSLMVDAHPGSTLGMHGESGGGTLQTGEGSNASHIRNNEVVKACENNMTQPENGNANEKQDVEKGTSTDGSFFDCNICLDLAKEPVVTGCGHLFCWSCLYKWLHIHSIAKECPVCKGEVTDKNVTPIFGRGNSAREPEEDVGFKIPDRPPARRVESLRQAIQRNTLSVPIEEMIQRLGSRVDLTGEYLQPQDSNGAQSTLERYSSLLNRFLTSRGRRREQNLAAPPNDVVDLTQENEAQPEITENHRRLPHLIYRRSHPYRNVSSTSVIPTPGPSSSQRVFGAVLRPPLQGRSQEQLQSVDDRDSFSSIAAVIQGESQAVDTAAEIDSTVSLSTSSSRRRNDGSRISDVDSEDSRSPRRRRLY